MENLTVKKFYYFFDGQKAKDKKMGPFLTGKEQKRYL